MQKLTVLGFALLCAAICVGQSTGDAAGQTPKKEATKNSSAKPKVITNDDLTPDGEQPAPQAKTPNSKPKPDADAAAFTRNAERTKQAILAQKTKIKDMQVQIEKLRSSIHYVETGVPANENQLQKKQAADRLQEQMELEMKKLTGMQEAARKAGFGSVVYEP